MLSQLAYSGAVFTHSYDRAQSKTPKALYCGILCILNHRGSETSEEAGRVLVGHTCLPCFITSQKNYLTFSLKSLKASHKMNAPCPQRTEGPEKPPGARSGRASHPVLSPHSLLPSTSSPPPRKRFPSMVTLQQAKHGCVHAHLLIGVPLSL